MDGCRRGDPGAQRRLFDRYRNRVYSIALHYLKGDSAAAQDATQEVFIRVFRAAPAFRADARLTTWLYRIVANVCIDELRRRRRFVLFGDMPPTLAGAVGPDDVAESHPRLRRALDALSPRLRITVLLRYYDDLSYEEIASALGCTTGTVASRLNRAHATLGALLEAPDA